MRTSTNMTALSPTSTTAPSRRSGELYQDLDIGSGAAVLDIMSSWVSHFIEAPSELVVLGMNERELQANPQASSYVVHDLNANVVMPFPDNRFDAATCCVSVDYLVRPIDVLREAARVVKPGGTVVCTFSNRCFPTKVVRGWLTLSEEQRCQVVAQYFPPGERIRRAAGRSAHAAAHLW